MTHNDQVSSRFSKSKVLQELLCRARISSGEILPHDKIVRAKDGCQKKQRHLNAIRFVYFPFLRKKTVLNTYVADSTCHDIQGLVHRHGKRSPSSRYCFSSDHVVKMSINSLDDICISTYFSSVKPFVSRKNRRIRRPESVARMYRFHGNRDAHLVFHLK